MPGQPWYWVIWLMLQQVQDGVFQNIVKPSGWLRPVGLRHRTCMCACQTARNVPQQDVNVLQLQCDVCAGIRLLLQPLHKRNTNAEHAAVRH